MSTHHTRTRGRILAVSLASATALAAATIAPSQTGAAVSPHPTFAPRTVVASGLNNPRQLSTTGNGALLVAEAGHGSNGVKNCMGKGDNRICIGKSGAVSQIRGGAVHRIMTGLLSGAGSDGSFATGSDGASKQPGGAVYSIITYAPPDLIPQGLPGKQAGKLIKKSPSGKIKIVANISRYEKVHDPDGEGVDTNPYSVLALRHQILVADAAADDILSVHKGKVSLWATMPEYGKKVDAVPTSLAKGPDGSVYVGELHSEIPKAAKVWKFNRKGDVLDSWSGFTTVTGVAHGADGSLYVSELFGGKCGFEDIPKCFPGRVVRVKPGGHRTFRRIPFPAGITVSHGKVYVAAFSTSPASGFGGNPEWSGQIWRIFK